MVLKKKPRNSDKCNLSRSACRDQRFISLLHKCCCYFSPKKTHPSVHPTSTASKIQTLVRIRFSRILSCSFLWWKFLAIVRLANFSEEFAQEYFQSRKSWDVSVTLFVLFPFVMSPVKLLEWKWSPLSRFCEKNGKLCGLAAFDFNAIHTKVRNGKCFTILSVPNFDQKSSYYWDWHNLQMFWCALMFEWFMRSGKFHPRQVLGTCLTFYVTFREKIFELDVGQHLMMIRKQKKYLSFDEM